MTNIINIIQFLIFELIRTSHLFLPQLNVKKDLILTKFLQKLFIPEFLISSPCWIKRNSIEPRRAAISKQYLKNKCNSDLTKLFGNLKTSFGNAPCNIAGCYGRALFNSCIERSVFLRACINSNRYTYQLYQRLPQPLEKYHLEIEYIIYYILYILYIL